MRGIIVGLVLAVLVAVFAVQNSQQVTIQAYFWSLPGVSLVLVILLSALVGVVLGALIGASRMWKMQGAHRQEVSQLKAERDAAVAAHQAMEKSVGTPGALSGPKAPVAETERVPHDPSANP